MAKMLWNTPEDLRKLLCELVSWESRTFTPGEREFPIKLQEKIKKLSYFKNNPHQISLHDVDFGRKLLTALYKHPKAVKTVVLISHFDTVQTEEYGELEPFAFHPEELTLKLHDRKHTLPESARIDLESGDYLFGRGTMDMKMGLATHMTLIEQASIEEWPINLLLLTVPDEEVNSAGMRIAIPELLHLQEEHDLEYSLFLNSEPSFTQHPGDETHYIYTGTMGKIMPAALFFGKETHVGEPLSGMTANYIASFMTQQMEWNAMFREHDLGETSPLPVSLHQKDLKLEYSTQTPYRASALYNVFLMKRNADEIFDLFEEAALDAASKCNISYQEICRRENISGVGEVRVIRYEELLKHANHKFGEATVEKLIEAFTDNTLLDDREKSLGIADELMIQCPELAPAMVILFAPPYYPAVNSSEDSGIADAVKVIKATAASHHANLGHIHYFNGICDLSYLRYTDSGGELATYKENTPVWGTTYSIPFEEMKQLQAPVLNVGPFGKDPHQRTERLHRKSAFVHTPSILKELLKSMMGKQSGTKADIEMRSVE
ncbi:M20/M25/M40 family metallo-hydrolase [Salipaludibacillus sp. CF4.18]|uniref:M20/M25/M40 family metallo-hydrolase n=1 Tax=Salipaludibacillus sp. CF4.18 TaxID=3373081 RepID=UPI003EE4AEA1